MEYELSNSIARRKLFNKKVTWKCVLTDVKIMTPQLSVFDKYVNDVFLEEDEDDLETDETEQENKKELSLKKVWNLTATCYLSSAFIIWEFSWRSFIWR